MLPRQPSAQLAYLESIPLNCYDTYFVRFEISPFLQKFALVNEPLLLSWNLEFLNDDCNKIIFTSSIFVLRSPTVADGIKTILYSLESIVLILMFNSLFTSICSSMI